MNQEPDLQFKFQEGETLLINKPSDWTSFDVVSKTRGLIRRFTDAKKIKVGHAGTLDPMATGLLIICTGKNTKKIHLYQDAEKEYTGVFTLGKTTPSFDAETEPDESYPTDHITEDDIYHKAEEFVGEQEQIPPVYSALKYKGERAYKYARQNKEIVLNPRKINIYIFEILNIKFPEIHFRVTCSKGTYIRALARDFGKALNTGAYLSSLTRTRIGQYKLEDALTIEQFETLIKQLYPDPS